MLCRKPHSFLLGIVLLFCSASANAFLFGVLGDSMSTAANTEDDCNDAIECLESMGTTSTFSFAHGQQPWSLFNRLKVLESGLSAAVSEAENGARWDDAPEQAQRLLQTPDIRIVHIEMGANDVCSDTLPTIQELAGIEFYIDETFTYLSEHMVNGAVIVSEVPDVVRVRDIHRTDPHFLFDTFQDLWDFNTGHLRGDAVDKICDEVFKIGFFCDVLGGEDLVELILDEGLEELIDQNDAKFPCQRVLGGGSTALDRQKARELNQQINALLAVKVQEYDSRNNNAFFLADNVEEGKFTKTEISDLDGFHLGKAGQEWLANLIWDSVGPKFFLPTPTTTTSTSSTTTTTSVATMTTSTLAAALITTTTTSNIVTTTTLPASVTTTAVATTTTSTVVSTTTTQPVTTTTLPSSELDTDGDSMTDLEEGNGDEDSDGIVDFLDNFNLDQGQLQVDVFKPAAGTLRADLGSLVLGSIGLASGGVGAGVTSQEISEAFGNAVDTAVEQSCVPDCFEFNVTNLIAGITVKIVLPLSGPIPAQAVYRKLIDGVWVNFVINATDGIGSARKNGEDCPLPGDDAYTTDGEIPNGLIPGYRCVQLWISDGGDNDADHLVNGVIKDPGGIAIPFSTAPVATGESGGGGGCSVANAATVRPLHRGDWWLLLLILVGMRIRRPRLANHYTG